MIVIIYYVLFIFCLIYSAYFAITGLWGFKEMHKSIIKKHKAKYKIAALIAARNEESVVPSLVKSLLKQDYPEKLFDVFVIPNNCNDDTEGAARKAGAKIINVTIPVKSKGEVLKFAFEQLKDKDYDAYIIFDADNIVDKNFIQRMNDTLCDGYEVAQAYRDSKNAGDNWITGSYSIFYWIQNFFFNRSRMYLNGSASINGTGFMIKKSVIENEGFQTYTLTEDVEFTAQCAIKNRRIAFVEDAITYDEQPLQFKASLVQRSRWTTGNLQCFARYDWKLIKAFFKNHNIAALDMALLFFAPAFQVLSFALTIMLILFKIYGIQLFDIFSYFFAFGLLFFILGYIGSIILNVFIVSYNRSSKVLNLISGILLFPVFLLSWIPINIKCLIKRDTKWKEIKHTRSVNIEEINH